MANSPRSRKSSDAKGNSPASKKFKGKSDATPAPTSQGETGENSPESQPSEPSVEEETPDVEIAVSQPVTGEPTVGEDAPVEAVTPIEEPTSELSGETEAVSQPVTGEPTVGEDAPVEAVTPIEEPTSEPSEMTEAVSQPVTGEPTVGEDAPVEAVTPVTEHNSETTEAVSQPVTGEPTVGEDAPVEAVTPVTEHNSETTEAVSQPVTGEPTVGEDAPVEAVTPVMEHNSESSEETEAASEPVAGEPTVGEDAPVEAVTQVGEEPIVTPPPASEPLTDDAVVAQALEQLSPENAPATEPVTDDAIIEQVLGELPTSQGANQPLTDDAVVGEALEQLSTSQPTNQQLTDDAIIQSVMEDIPGTDEAIVSDVAAYSGYVEPESPQPQVAAATSSPELGTPEVRQSSVNIDEAYELFRNNEFVTTEASPVEVVVDSPTQPLGAMKEEVLAFLSQLPENLGSFFTEYKRPLTTVGLIIAILITFKVLVGIVDIVNEIPLVKPTFETVGLGYSAWFIYRYLLKAETRKELGADFQALKEEVLGKKS